MLSWSKYAEGDNYKLIMNIEDLKPANMEIKVLGTGCSKCKTLEKITQQAVSELNIKADIEKVEDIQQIMQYGIMSTPGLVINGKVVVSGRVPKVKELKKLIQQ